MSQKPIKVFIVEDDPMVADINKRMVEKVKPFKVVGLASNEQEGLAKIGETKPDLVLLDVYLTKGNGLSLLQFLRQKEIPCDVILITAAKDTETIYKTLRYGAIDYIIKPFNLERLEIALKNFLKLRTIMDKKDELSQAELDLFNNNPGVSEKQEKNLPKGVHLLTLNHIVNFLLKEKKPLTCQEIADSLSMSKITVWRYLEFLAESNKVSVDLDYGTVGRPSKKYYVSL
ncbi:response regulator [Desulfotomaculum sp. 1211_IL3151]|uniref:response regulator n=1 Tax=Desulfotomaculum sp. 1211_IL3151 TaxID=3084055 RepID=UPI002FD8E085